MTDDAIKEALRAAALALQAAVEAQARAIRKIPTAREIEAADNALAAAAVAAFLRALSITHFGMGAGFRSGPGVSDELAAAVERAAREEGR